MSLFLQKPRARVVESFVAQALGGEPFVGDCRDWRGRTKIMLGSEPHQLSSREVEAGILEAVSQVDHVRGTAHDLSPRAQFNTFRFLYAASTHAQLKGPVSTDVLPHMAETTFSALAQRPLHGQTYRAEDLERMRALASFSSPPQVPHGRARRLAKIYAKDEVMHPLTAVYGLINMPELTTYIGPAERNFMMGRLHDSSISAAEVRDAAHTFAISALGFNVRNTIPEWSLPLLDLAYKKERKGVTGRVIPLRPQG